MGQFREVERMFRGVSYNQFQTVELKSAFATKIDAVKTKIQERRGRVSKLMVEHSITDALLSDLVIQYMKDQQAGRSRMSYSNSAPESGTKAQDSVMVPAGAIANLVTEKELIESESAEVQRMALIVRNLKDQRLSPHPQTGEMLMQTAVHTLSDDEIEYLGF